MCTNVRLLCVWCLLVVFKFNLIDISATESGVQDTRDSCTSTDSACASDENTRHDKDSKTKYQEPAAGMTDTVIDKDDEHPRQKSNEYESEFELPKLTRIDPGQVGDIVEVELEEGKFYKRITRAINPPIFEIPNYLSFKETRVIISAALDAGLETSGVVGEEIEEFFKDAGKLSEVPRVSETSWVPPEVLPPRIMGRLTTRLTNLVQLPEIYIENSEAIQVVSYVKKGHYHAHLDTSNSSDLGHLPCCFQSPHCVEVMEDDTLIEECCRICRYATVLFYLTDTEEGGETAFPLADTTDELLEKKMTGVEENGDDWNNLSDFCHKASVVVKPKLGTAVMWYNHYIDETGYLGETDFRSFHGGCDVIKGTKWIANNWITASPYLDRRRTFILPPDSDEKENDDNV